MSDCPARLDARAHETNAKASKWLVLSRTSCLRTALIANRQRQPEPPSGTTHRFPTRHATPLSLACFGLPRQWPSTLKPNGETCMRFFVRGRRCECLGNGSPGWPGRAEGRPVENSPPRTCPRKLTAGRRVAESSKGAAGLQSPHRRQQPRPGPGIGRRLLCSSR